ncbi:MAG: hypothetical protein KDC34_11510 [Saprospiraceae bacterium]|nr:hypothetical protein [Saprospiraceae bacterium]
MKRRKFLKKAAITAAGSIAFPYLLPSGRLFASGGGPPMAEHVVFVMFAGGVRQQEAVEKRYLSESQGLDVEGNIMYNMLSGEVPELKIVYGTDTPDGQPGGQPISPILQTPLDQQGILFKEVRFSSAGTGHFTGLSTGVSGYYGTTQGLQQRPLHPTIFEYARRFGGFKATDTWFIGNGIGNSTPLLNHSEHRDFGWEYGANFFAPTITFGEKGEQHLKGFKSFHPEEELEPIEQMRYFLNQNFLQNGGRIPHLNNTEEEKEDIKAFIREVFDRKDMGQLLFPPVTDNGDLATVGYATEILRYFKPKLTVVNMSAVDSCHESYTSYLKALHRADHAVGFLWNYIQTQVPEMANNTVLIVMPEHGRNLNSNGILDENDWFAFDHDSDANSRRIFTMMAGPGIDGGLELGSEANPIGDASDVVPTIAEVLGFKNEVLNSGWLHSESKSLFDQI